MKVAVAGCNGFIGGHLVEGLLADGHDVVGLDDRERPAWGKLDALRVELDLERCQERGVEVARGEAEGPALVARDDLVDVARPELAHRVRR